MRLALALTSLMLFVACGSVCDQVVSAEDGVKSRGQACGNSNYTPHDANKCNNGLSKCSPDDVKAMDNYIQCLNNVGTCDSSSSLSWGLQVAGCAQPLFSLSLSCAGATGL